MLYSINFLEQNEAILCDKEKIKIIENYLGYSLNGGYTMNGEFVYYIHLGFSNDIHLIVPFLRFFRKLEIVHFNNCFIEKIEFPEENTIRVLNLSFNKLSEIEFIKNLTKIEKLNLRHNNIKTITECENLNILELDISNNPLINIQNIDLPSLRFLYLNNCEINDINGLQKLNGITLLSISSNLIGDDQLGNIMKFKKLKVLDLNNNNLNNLPLNFALFLKDRNIKCSLLPNNFKNPPKAIIDNGITSVIAYYSALEKGYIINDHIKIILVGNSTVGKSSFLDFFLSDIFDEKQNSTHGIIHKNVKYNFFHKSYNISFWDFGGQEYYHATHRLFLSENSIYLLLWEKNKNTDSKLLTTIHYENSKLELELEHFNNEYWVENIRIFSKKSPIILVQTKSDLNEYILPSQNFLNKYGIQEKHFHISIKNSFLYKEKNQYDLKKYYNEYENLLSNLEETISKNISPKEFPKIWNHVRNKIIALSIEINYLNFEDFENIYYSFTDDKKTNKNEIKEFAKYLHETGVILYFEEIPDLKNLIFIDIHYILENIYKVLSRKLLDHNGKFSKTYAEIILNDETDFFISLMKSPKFELIFDSPNENNVYIAPQYLPETFQGDENVFTAIIQQLNFVSFSFRFPFSVNKNAMLRLLSFFGNKSYKNIFWKNGLIINDGKVIVFIESCFKTRKISIKISEHNKFSNILQDIFYKLLSSCDWTEKTELSLNEINYAPINIWQENLSEYQRNETFKSFIYNGAKFELNYLMFLKNKVLERNKIFISYSHEDIDYLHKIKRHLKVLRNENLEFDFWDDTKIQAGDNWEYEINRSLNNASVVILLISTDFLASDYIVNNELPQIFDNHHKKGVILIPIILKPCRFDSHDILKHFQSLNSPNSPISSLSENDQEKLFVKLTARISNLSK